LASKEQHPCFRPPADLNVPIWRYIDLAKYLALLNTRALYFSRSDRLGDPYEGATSHRNKELRPAVYAHHSIPDDQLDAMSKFTFWIRQWTFVNCWNMNAHESAAMWKLYATSGESIAIQTTYKRLCEALPDNVFVGVVNYIDYEKDWLPEGNTFWPFVHKRKSFEHEREIRAVIQELPSKGGKIQVGLENEELGRLIPVSLPELVVRVVVSPASPKWFADIVKAVSEKFGQSFPVSHSTLIRHPEF
jgi:hypothetical protein